ncbi:unnamed protein product [Rhizoctonia solani]|uniref:Helicase C-terminal domain-containing protein n=1 Tax=Rhizoctonia solani TaxID=456999 RepID=A0A8H3CUN2_9AGAM|nr:unnamed protein product [Rhizoctonia solani]
MPAVNKAYACLVFRFTVTAVCDPNKKWDFFPFNNDRFCQTAGIASTDTGLSLPPAGALGTGLTQDVREAWPTKVEQALDWLARCDAHIAALGQSKPKGWEGIQKNVLTVVEGHESWEWLVSHFFGAPNGLYDKLKELMRDHRCDGYAAYQRARMDQMSRQKDLFREWKVTDITKLDNYWPSAQEGLTRALCGDALGTGSPPVSWYPTIRALVARIFEPTARSIHIRVQKLKAQEEQLEAALEAANLVPNKETLRKVTALYGKLLTQQRSLGITGKAEEIGLWRTKVDALMKSLGRETQGGQTVRGKGSHPKARLVSEADLDAAWISYQETVWVPPISPSSAEQRNDPSDNDELTDNPLAGLNAFPQDAGVDKWKTLSVEDIETSLGVPASGLPGAALGPDGTPALRPSWSQWVAILEMANRSFTKDGELGTPTLLADEVGFGKTGEVIGYIQLLWHLKIMQDSNPTWPNTDGFDIVMKWPPVFGETLVYGVSPCELTHAVLFLPCTSSVFVTYAVRVHDRTGDRKSFMGRGKIPALPSIIVVSPTLMAQWNAELRAWLSPTACHILEYRGNSVEREMFFSKGREYDLAMSRKHKERTIILAEAPSVINESKNVLFIPGDRATAAPNTGPAHLVSKSIYGREYLLGVLEESHAYRNWGDNFQAMLSLMDKSLQRISVTATPLHSHPRNLLHQGRLLRAPNFIGPNGAGLTKKVEAQFKLHLKAWNNDPEEQQSLRRFLASLYSTTNAGEADANATLIDHLLGEQGQSLASYRPFWSAREGLFTLRDELKNMIIRRDRRSVDNKGQSLLPHITKVDSMSYFAMDARTDAAVATTTATKKARSDCRVDISGWLTEIKKALLHPILIAERDDSDTRTFKEWVVAQFPTRAAYQANPSAKLDRLLLCVKQHHGNNSRDAPPLYWNRDGTLKENSPQIAGAVATRAATRRRKIVVFCNVSENWTLASHILNLHGYSTLHINGMITRAARDAAAQEFQSETGHDVLFISEVGTQGLNLQRGSIVIFLDHPWSASDAQQIMGRVERLGQKDSVYIYRLTCPNSVDELIQEYASGKRLMSQVYTGECAIRGVRAGADNGLESDEEDQDPQAPPANPPPPKPSTRSKGKGKAPPQPLRKPHETETDVGGASSSPAKRKRPSRAKQPDPDFPELGVPPRAGSKKRREYDEKLAELKRLRDENLTNMSQEHLRSDSRSQTDEEMEDMTPPANNPQESEEFTGIQFQPSDQSPRAPSSKRSESEGSQISFEHPPGYLTPTIVMTSDNEMELDPTTLYIPRVVSMRPPSRADRKWRRYRDHYVTMVREARLTIRQAQWKMQKHGLTEIPTYYFEERQPNSSEGSLEHDYGSSSSSQHLAGKGRKQPVKSPEQEIIPLPKVSAESSEGSDSGAGSDQNELIGLVAEGKLKAYQAQQILRESGQKPISKSRMPVVSHVPRTRETKPKAAARILPAKFPPRRPSQGLKAPSPRKPRTSLAKVISTQRSRSDTTSKPATQKAPQSDMPPSESPTESPTESSSDDKGSSEDDA